MAYDLSPYLPPDQQMNASSLMPPMPQSMGAQMMPQNMQPQQQMPMQQPAPQQQSDPNAGMIRDILSQFAQNRQQQPNGGLVQQILANRMQPSQQDIADSGLRTMQSFGRPDLYKATTPEQIMNENMGQQLAPYTTALGIQKEQIANQYAPQTAQADLDLKRAQASFFNAGGVAAAKPEAVFDPLLNGGQGGFRFATPIETRNNPNLQPASTVPPAMRPFGNSPTGTPITVASQQMDQKTLDALNAKMVDMKDPQAAMTSLVQLLDKYPQMNSQTMNVSNANRYIPGFNLPQSLGTIPPEDLQQIMGNVGALKAVAMGNSKNIRNMKEFQAITAPADILGGNQGSAKAMAYGLGASALQSKAYTEFKNAYFDQYKTLQGSDEIWQQYINQNEPVTRDQNKVVNGLNQKMLSPQGWYPFIQKAPQLLTQIRGSGTIDNSSSNTPSSNSDGGQVLHWDDVPK